MGKGNLEIVTEENTEKKQKKKKKKNHHKNKKSKPLAIAPIQLIGENYQDNQDMEIDEEEPQIVQEKIPNKIIFNHKHKLKHLAICFPDSILQIPQNSDLRAYFVSEMARISSIFKVDEIIILRDHAYTPKSDKFKPAEYLVRNLQYLQTPQYLRKYLFKMHPDLQKAGIMNPIQCPHHLKTNDVSQFREGVSLQRPTKKGAGSWVDIGLAKQAQMDSLVLPNTRLTLRVQNYDDPDPPFYKAEAVSKKAPCQQKNLYWGYDVRIANNIKQMIGFEEQQYDLKILCNHQENVPELNSLSDFEENVLEDKSMLIFFSGTDDLSTLIHKDEKARIKVQDAHRMFDYAFKFQNFGVQQLRIEEQMFMSLTKLSKFLQ